MEEDRKSGKSLSASPKEGTISESKDSHQKKGSRKRRESTVSEVSPKKKKELEDQVKLYQKQHPWMVGVKTCYISKHDHFAEKQFEKIQELTGKAGEQENVKEKKPPDLFDKLEEEKKLGHELKDFTLLTKDNKYSNTAVEWLKEGDSLSDMIIDERIAMQYVSLSYKVNYHGYLYCLQCSEIFKTMRLYEHLDNNQHSIFNGYVYEKDGTQPTVILSILNFVCIGCNYENPDLIKMADHVTTHMEKYLDQTLGNSNSKGFGEDPLIENLVKAMFDLNLVPDKVKVPKKIKKELPTPNNMTALMKLISDLREHYPMYTSKLSATQ